MAEPDPSPAPAISPDVQPARRREEQRSPTGKTNPAEARSNLVPVFALSAFRDTDPDLSESVNRVELSPQSKSMILLLELEPNPGLQAYRVALSTIDGRSVWRASGLKPNFNQVLALSFDSGLFKPNAYQLTLEGLDAQGRYLLVGRY